MFEGEVRRMTSEKKHTLIGRRVRVQVHHGVENIPVHFHHGGEQTLEVGERVVEQRPEASAVTGNRCQELRKEEDGRVDVIRHLGNERTVMSSFSCFGIWTGSRRL